MASLFATFLGYNPIHELLAPTGVLAHLPAHNVATLTGKQFFPLLIAGPFHHGLVIVFSMAITVLRHRGLRLAAARRPLRVRRGRRRAAEHWSGKPGPGEHGPGSTVPGNGTAANGADDPGPLADTALGTSPELAIEVAAEVTDETTRDPHP